MDQETNLKINVESGSLKDLNQQLKEVSEKWQSVKVGTEAYKAFYKQVQALQKSIKAAGAEIDVNGNLISKLKTNIFSLVPGLSSVQDGFTALNTTMLEVAANPVLGTLVAISAIAIALYKAFANTKDGAKQLSVMFAGFNEVGSQVQELLGSIASVIAAVLIPVIKLIVNFVSQFISVLQSLSPEFNKTGESTSGFSNVMKALGDVLQPVIDLIMALVKSIIQNLIIAFNLILLPIKISIAVWTTLYEKFALVRGIIDGIVLVFKGLIFISAKVIDVFTGLSEALDGLITRDPAKVKKGLEDAVRAGKEIGEGFSNGFKDGIKGDKSTEAEDIQTKLNKATKEGKDLDVEHSKILMQKDKALMMVKLGQKGSTEALKQAEAAEESYGKKVLDNKKNILDLAKQNLKLKPEDKNATQAVRDAEKDYNETLSEGYRIKTKLGLQDKRLNLKNKKEETEAQKKLKAAYKGKLADLVNSHKKLIGEEKKHTEEYDDEIISASDDEIKFYQEHYKDLGITKEEADKHIIELEKQKSDDIEEQSGLRIENDKKDLKAKDELDVKNAENDDQKLAAQLKKLKDENEEKLSNDKLTANERLLIKKEYEDAVDKLNNDYWDNKSKKELESDKADLERINKEEEYDKKHTKNKYDLINQLADLQKQKRQAELDQEQDKYDELIRLANQNGDDTTQIIKDHADKVNQINQEQSDSDIALSKSKTDAQIADMEAVSNASSALASLFGEQTAAAKGLAIASAIINTFTGATKALSTYPGPVGIASAVAVIATGLASVQKIVSTKVPGGKGSSGGSTSAPTITQFQAPSMMGIGGLKITNPKDYAQQRVVVVESDITKSQQRVKTIQHSAVLGG